MTINTEQLFQADRFIHEKYVKGGLLPGFAWSVIVDGDVVHTHHDRYDEDAIFRIYSMSKPITSIAMLMLLERGQVRLADPVHKWIPAFEHLDVFAGGSSLAMRTEPAQRAMNIQDLFTHTSGLTYGWMFNHPVDHAYRKRGIGSRTKPLAEMCELLAEVPLLFSPGTAWNYSLATDVLGHLVELISGVSLDEFFRTEIFEPLGMPDTAFHVDDARASRLVPNTAIPSKSPFGVPPNAPSFGSGELVIIDDNRETGEFRSPPAMLSGGGGLTSTLADYTRFLQMLVNQGELNGHRLIGSRTLQFAGLNHLPGGAALSDIGVPISDPADQVGMGFGLGFSVVLEPAQQRIPQSTGTLAWGGAASTLFWWDPVERLAVVGMTQVMPSWANDLGDELRQMVYAAL